MIPVIAALRGELGDAKVRVGAAIPDRNRADWSGLPAVQPAALLLPDCTADV